MEGNNKAIPNEEKKKSRWRFLVASAIAVVLVTATSTGIVLAYQMRLRHQAGVLGAQVDQGPHVLVQSIRSSVSARQYEIPITMRG